MALEFSNEQPEQKSKYNAAIAQLIRLDNLWKDAHNHSRSRQFVKWNLDLDAVWRELSEDTKQGSEFETEFASINEALNKVGVYKSTETNGFATPNHEELNRLAQVYALLMRKEIFLRRLQNNQGKGSVKEDSVDDYMD